MKLYNIHTDKIGDFRIIKPTTPYYAERLTEKERNQLGYYDVQYPSTTTTNIRHEDIVQKKQLIGNKYIITYKKIK